MPQKMPVFTIEEDIHDHFVKEYDITGKTESNKPTTFNWTRSPCVVVFGC